MRIVGYHGDVNTTVGAITVGRRPCERTVRVTTRDTTQGRFMAKKVTGFVKLQIPAGKANPAPPVGTALGPQGINIMAFCKEFNARTQGQDTILPVEITIFSDKSFTFILKTPPAAILVKKALGLEKGSGSAEPQQGRQVTKAQVRQIAEIKMPDLNCDIDRVGDGDGRRRGALDGRGGRRLMPSTERSTTTRRRTATSRTAYQAQQAIDIVKNAAFAKFDETVEIAVRLGVDPRHADQVVRGTVVLPPVPVTVRVLVIAVGDKAREAEAAGADFVGVDIPRRSRTAGSSSTS